MKKTLLLAVITALAISGCRKEPDIYEDFKTDATPRWEWENGSIVKTNESSSYIFITDESKSLFGSDKYKTGRITTANNNDYEIIEFSGAPAVGKPENPSIRKPSGIINLYSLDIVKIENGILWIVFQETETSAERRIVQ